MKQVQPTLHDLRLCCRACRSDSHGKLSRGETAQLLLMLQTLHLAMRSKGYGANKKFLNVHRA